MALPSLPPAFQLIRLDREVAAFERAIRAAPRGIEHGTVYWSERADLLDMALVLEPEAPASASLEAVHLLTVAGCEALAQLVPPALPVACAWPGDLLLDGARLGGVRAAMAPTIDPAAPPPWLVIGLRLRLDPFGAASDTTTAAALVEAVTRHFLRWTGRMPGRRSGAGARSLEPTLLPPRRARRARAGRRADRRPGRRSRRSRALRRRRPGISARRRLGTPGVTSTSGSHRMPR